MTGILTEQKLISDCRYRVIESSSLVPVLFREVFSHPYISFFHLLVIIIIELNIFQRVCNNFHFPHQFLKSGLMTTKNQQIVELKEEIIKTYNMDVLSLHKLGSTEYYEHLPVDVVLFKGTQSHLPYTTPLPVYLLEKESH